MSLTAATTIFATAKVAAGLKINRDDPVGRNASGYLEPMTDARALWFIGTALQNADNTSGGDGAISCQFTPNGADGTTALFNAANPIQAWMDDGVHVFFLGAGPGASTTVGLTASSTFKNTAGRVQEIKITGASAVLLVDITQVYDTSVL